MDFDNELGKFNTVLRKMMSVSREELHRREEEWKREQERKKQARTSPASPSSVGKD